MELQENKYYIPSVEDFIYGYEYEQYVAVYTEAKENKSYWTKCIFRETFMYGDSLSYNIKSNCIRVAYLNKEDIENEGWTLHAELSGEELNSVWYNFRNELYEIRWWGNPDYIEIYNICEECKNDRGLETGKYWLLYQGKCPSINEFRYIMKLLNIK